MKTIRQGVFETNSSSTHAICIAPSYDDNFPDSITFEQDDFGWGCGIHRHRQARLDYLNALLEYDDTGELREKIKNTLNKHNIKTTFHKGGMIDHGNEAFMLLYLLANNEDLLLRYLFGESFIITGNDNDDWYGEVMQGYENELEDYDVFEKDN